MPLLKSALPLQAQIIYEKCPATSSADHLCKVRRNLNGDRNGKGR